ncbi:hypothetical protein FQA39_LY17947 [Lamprigera yunnana]|nr:hypothetical protein FQA39_LY17947 [Lamprigera yunnana]
MLYSVFDIYFVSPIHHGMTPHKSELQAQAKRLVLFVADGLRARSLYGTHMKTYAPFLNDIVEHIGFWGISHTQVPTESRPGHIALLAGFNEDPSAITRGWHTNPVDFDSVINQSTNAWCWGSPDIVNMFNKDNLSRIHLFSYNADIQDFSQKINSTTALDIWVFKKVKEFINSQNPHSCQSFCEKGNVLFLHLLGLDTAGHSIKPDSKGYVENINLVDDGIKNTVQLVENYFGDGMTSYVFTADHGMTDWGSHGDGSEDETDVPLIVWGAGVSHNSVKKDVEQIDIAPLLSSLIGINIPINSLGVVPLDVIKGSDAYKANLLLANALQLFEQYKKKHDFLQTNTLSYAFRPYSNSSIGDIDEYLTSINIYILLHQFEKAVNRTNTFIKFCKEGIKYYLSYYQNVLLFFVTFGFLGWIMYLFISIIMFRTLENGIHMTQHQNEVKNIQLVRGVIHCVLILLCILVFVLSLPMKYYIYCIFCFTWWMVGQNINKLFQSFSIVDGIQWNSFLYSAFGYIIGIEILVTSLFEREVISILILYYFWKCCNDRCHYKDVYGWLKDVLITGILAICPVTLQLQTVFDSQTVAKINADGWVSFCCYSTAADEVNEVNDLDENSRVLFKLIEAKFNGLEVKFNGLDSKIDNTLITVKEKLCELDDRVLKLEDNNVYLLENVISEINKRNSKECNCIIYKLEDSENAAKKDIELFKNLLACCNDEPSFNINDIKLIRLGKKFKSGVDRPLKVVFPNKDCLHWFFHNKKMIIEKSKKSIIITGDLTNAQRDFRNKVLSEIKLRREKGEDNLFMKYINGIPTIVSKDESFKQYY